MSKLGRTRRIFALSFLRVSMYNSELMISLLGKKSTRITPWESQKQAIILSADFWALNFLVLGEFGWRHSIDLLDSGSKWYTKVSSPVMILFTKVGSPWWCSRNWGQQRTLSVLWSSVSCLGTQQTDTFKYPREATIEWALLMLTLS